MQKLVFLCVFLFSTTLLATGTEDISLQTRYAKGGWSPEKEVPSSFYDVPGDRSAASAAQPAEEVSVDDVFAENAQLFTEDSFKEIAVENLKNK